MSGILAFLSALPELLSLVRTLKKQMDLQLDDGPRNKRKDIKKNLEKISKAIEENDEKALNDVFNSI